MVRQGVLAFTVSYFALCQYKIVLLNFVGERAK